MCSGSYEWTEWFNLDSPDGDGDLELISLYKLGCGNQSKLDQVVTVDGLIPFNQTGQIVHFSPRCYGFMCLNRLQENGTECLDYQIRQCCPVGTTNNSTNMPISTASTESQSSIITSTTTTTTTTTTTIPPKRNQLKYTFNSTNRGHTALVYTMLAIGDDKLATGSFDYNIKVWNSKKGELIYSFDNRNNGHDGNVYSLTTFQNKNYLASSSEDTTVKIYNLTNGNLVFSFDEFYGGHLSFVYSLAVLPNDRLASGSEGISFHV